MKAGGGLGEDGSTEEGFKVGGHEGKRILVLDVDVIELSVVYARCGNLTWQAVAHDKNGESMVGPKPQRRFISRAVRIIK